MIWDYEGSVDGNELLLPLTFTSQLVAIEIAASNRRETWYRAGYLKSFVDLDGALFSGRDFKLPLGRQLLEIPYRSYRLQFEPVEWLENTTIRIKQLSTTQIDRITNMYVTSSSKRLATAAPIYTVVIPTQPNDPQPVFEIAQLLARRSVLITNKTSKAVYIKEGAAASEPPLIAGEPFVSIGAGQSYTIEDWDGEIVGRMAGTYAVGGKIIVKELPYLLDRTEAAAGV